TAQSLVSQTQRPLLIAGEDAGQHYPLTVVYTGSAAARRALDLAARLSRAEPARLRVVVWDAGGAPSGTAKLEQEVRRLAAIRSEAGEPGVIILPVTHSTDDLLAALAALDGGTLVLPHEQADLISQHSGPTLLVP